MPNPNEPRINGAKINVPANGVPKHSEPQGDTPKRSDLTPVRQDDVSNNLRVIFRRKRRLALAKQRHGKRCSLLVLLRVVFHVYRRMHRRVMHMLRRTFVGVNLVRVLHRRPDVIKPLD